MKKILYILNFTIATLGFSQVTIDPTFEGHHALDNPVKKLVKTSDGKIYVIGEFSNYGTTTTYGLMRLNANGTIDTTFPQIETNSPYSTPHNVIEVSNGKLLVIGSFNSFNGTACHSIIRLNSDGTIDTTFNTSTGVSYSGGSIGSIETAVETSDGKYYIGGAFDKFGTTNRKSIARLNADGTLDTTFDPGYGFNTANGATPYVHVIKLLSDNSLVIGGRFHSYNGTGRQCIARINSNGVIQNNFDASVNADITNLEQLPDGKFLISGSFTSINGVASSRIARLTANGTIDTSFSSTITNNWVHDFKVLPDGKIMAVGAFTNSGNQIYYLARLNSNGTLDNTYTTANLNHSNNIFAITFDSSNRPILGGTFYPFVGFDGKFLMRLNEPIATLNLSENTQSLNLNISPNPTTGLINIIGKDTSYETKIFNSEGRLVKEAKTQQIDIESFPNGTYMVVVKDKNNHIHSFKVIKK